jgi:hypothetical protein
VSSYPVPHPRWRLPQWRHKLDHAEQFVCWHRNGTWFAFPSFVLAERHAQRTAVLRGAVEITRGERTLAWVRADEFGQVRIEAWPPMCLA